MTQKLAGQQRNLLCLFFLNWQSSVEVTVGAVEDLGLSEFKVMKTSSGSGSYSLTSPFYGFVLPEAGSGSGVNKNCPCKRPTYAPTWYACLSILSAGPNRMNEYDIYNWLIQNT